MKNKSEVRESILQLHEDEKITYNKQIITAIMIIQNDQLEEFIQQEYIRDN